jgi:hypothetical protein
MANRKPYYATLDRNGTEDEITLYNPDGRRMLCVAFWDEPDIVSSAVLKADALLIVDALNTYKERYPRQERRARKEVARMIEWGKPEVVPPEENLDDLAIY